MRNKNVTFSDFWDAYGLKLDKRSAERAWKRLGEADRRAALAGIEAYQEDCRQRGIARMYPQGYLTHRRWEDERAPIPEPTPLKTPAPEKEPSLFPDDMETW